jgi:hypothetical protein
MPTQEIIDIEDNLVEDTIFYMILASLEEDGALPKPRQARHGGGANGRIAAYLYLDRLLNCGHSDRIKAALRMSRDTFFSLRNWLTTNSLLKASKHISVELKLAIFIFITSRPASQRDTMERYPVGNRVISE